MVSEDLRAPLEDFIYSHFHSRQKQIPARAHELWRSMQYSLFGGGKRFRPLVSVLTAEALGCARDRIWPFAAAVEFVHTYSLIHDDLPCMDNDDFRRGQPTNHRMYGEGLALLAGDALLTEAFYILAENYSYIPDVGLELTRLLGEAAGLTGMIAGQVMDVSITAPAKDELLKVHELKTGALIGVAVEGVAVLARATVEKRKRLAEFGRLLGFAFQLADDVLDHDPQKREKSSFAELIGLSETKELLMKTTQQALNQLESFGPAAQKMRDLVEFNSVRKK